MYVLIITLAADAQVEQNISTPAVSGSTTTTATTPIMTTSVPGKTWDWQIINHKNNWTNIGSLPRRKKAPKFTWISDELDNSERN